jgi:single-strand DNA-binding protein
MLIVTVTGHVASDPRINTVGETEVANFTVYSNFKKGGEDITTAVDCAVWGKRSEVAGNYIKKGSLVTVSGSGYVEVYEKRDGTPGSKISMNVSDFTLPPKPKADDL